MLCSETGGYEGRGRINCCTPESDCIVKIKVREAVYKKLKEIGFMFVTIDMQGYRLGSMNATLILNGEKA